MLARVASAQVTELLPNLEPFPASDVQLVSGADGLELRFSATSWNRGVGPFELHGGELVGENQQNVYQLVRQTDRTYSTYLVGTFEFHPEHNHFHFEDYALYELLPVDAPGASGLQGAKISFCILDNTKVNTQLPNAPKRAVYTTCNPDVQGMSVGWGDRYGYALPGQSLPFGDNPSGDYLLRITIDPNHQLHESDPSNNVSCALLRIDGSALSVAVIGSSCNTTNPVTVSDISPNSVRAGSSVPVVITGAGFTTGMSVTFENGSGKKPVASNVNVVDAGTISASVSVPSGGSTSDPVWDVRVGPAVLKNGFTVTR
jgi:hypothetical protein